MKNKNRKTANELTEPLNTSSKNNVKSDVDGSYTGYAEDGSIPVQDADDL